MNAIERFKQGGCYVCPQSLHEYALLLNMMVDNELLSIANASVHLMIFGHVAFLYKGKILEKNRDDFMEDITEKFFKELENDNPNRNHS